MNEFSKLTVFLQPEDGWPPYSAENLWVKREKDSRWRIDSVPFFARDVSFGDFVEIHEDNLVFQRVTQQGGHSTLRAIISANEELADVAAKIKRLGAETELMTLHRLLAIDIPPNVALAPVLRLLSILEAENRLTYEESCLQHPVEP